jgi:hypothetical protein
MRMEKLEGEGFALFFELQDQESAELLRQAVEKSFRIIQEHWGFEIPANLRVYVMTSWQGFIFHSAPWLWKVFYSILYPLMCLRTKRIWKLSVGWSMPYPGHPAIGVKPPRLLETAYMDVGDRILTRDVDNETQVQLVACHEVTHAFTAHLKLPAWLNEGLAMVTVDLFHGEATVRKDSVEVLAKGEELADLGRSRKISIENKDVLVYQFGRGYWLVRYLMDTKPHLLKDLLSRRIPIPELEGKVATAYDMDRETFWKEIDGIVVAHFRS